MSVPRGRVIRRVPRGSVVPVRPIDAPRPMGTLMKEVVARASVDASERLAAAERRARAIVEEAEETASVVRTTAHDEGQKAGAAELAAAWIKLQKEEGRREERDLERTIDLARAMAERLVGESIDLAPEKIRAIARQVLSSARQARRIVIRAHPDDAVVLEGDARSAWTHEIPRRSHEPSGLARGRRVSVTLRSVAR